MNFAPSVERNYELVDCAGSLHWLANFVEGEQVTPDERQALRAVALVRNANDIHYEDCYKFHSWCAVIKVLDATEPDPDCEHLTEMDEGSCYISFNYCPRCGVKL